MEQCDGVYLADEYEQCYVACEEKPDGDAAFEDACGFSDEYLPSAKRSGQQQRPGSGFLFDCYCCCGEAP